MALNITFDGFCLLDDGSLSSSNVYFQGLFYPNGTASSPTTWNNVRTVEATGYYSCNLGDNDWLGQDGTALTNVKVVIVFWRGSTTDRNALCDELNEWGAFEVTLDGSDFYTNVVQTKTNIAPNLVWSLTNSGYVDTNYTATNTSYDVHNWTISGTQMYHWRTRYGEDIQLINTISGSRYDWDDGDSDLVAGTTNADHQWSSAGSYDVELVIWDECSASVTGTDTINIYWHAPVPDITMSPADPDPNEPVSFSWTGTDVDNRITNIEWTINDNGAYGNTDTTTSGDRDDVIPHSAGTGTDWCGQAGNAGAFTNPGSHLIEITYYWNDGFSDHTDTYSESFTQDRFSGPSVDFNQVPAQAVVGSGVTFTNETTDTSRVGLGLPDCDQYDWTWTDNGVSDQELDKPHSFDLERTPGSANCQVELCANWSDGWDPQSTCETKDVVFSTAVTITPEDCYYILNIVGTADDGTTGSYSWTVASGSSETGPWTDIWYSPSGLDQNNKKVCFTDVSWYKITGYVHSSGAGGSTSDYETLYIDTVCEGTTSGVLVVPIEEYTTLTEELDIKITGEAYTPKVRARVEDDD